MPYYGDALPYYYGGPFSNHSSLMTGTGRTLHSPLGTSRYAPHLTTISESPLSALRRYSPAVTMTSRPKRVIDTADIDVSTPRTLSHNNNNSSNHRNRLRRDRPTIRIRSQALKDNPALREHYERHEKTVGELLVEKFLIKEKKAEGGEGENRTKLYTQVSLEDGLTKKQHEELQEAIQRRVTRRMTRRRSSADVQMDQEQLEREVIFAQAQADALDSLVAQEQAEIEVETRMGTLIRKNLVRTVAPLQGLSGEDDDETRTKKLGKKMKKRKKTTDKPSPPSGSELDSEQDDTRIKRTQKENKEPKDKASKNNAAINGDAILNLESHSENEANEKSADPSLSPTKGLKFKIEASNSVGDFSTLWINANAAEEQEQQRIKSQAIVEQFRDSVRLPAPKSIVEKIGKVTKKDGIVEEHQEIVVLPVKKRYVKDDARNSVYLTLKTQKSAIGNKMADEKETRKNGDVVDAESSIESLTDDTTKTIIRQPRVNKVAKFRSKDITQSDVEVESISELTGQDGTTKGKIGTKDVGLQKLSGSNGALAKKSISVSSKGDAIANATITKLEAPSNGEISKIIDTTRKDDSKNLATVESRDSNEFFKIENSGSIVAAIETPKIDKIVDKVVDKNRTALKLDENVIDEKIEKPLLKRVKKETNDLRKNDNKSVEEEEAKRSKPNVTSSQDFSWANGENLQKRKIVEKEELGETDSSSTTRISSSVTPSSNVVESLPNASTINSPEVENRLNDAVKIPDVKFNVAKVENEKTRIVENSRVNDDLSLSRKIAAKFVETQDEISKPIGVTQSEKEVDDPGNSYKVVKDESQDVVQKTIVESPKILPETKNNVIHENFENDKKIEQESIKKTTSSPIAPQIDDKNVADSSKLRKNRKLPISSSIDKSEVVESPRHSSDLEVVSDDSKKIQTRTKKRVVADKPPKESSRDTAEIAIETNGSKDSSITEIGETLVNEETAKLTNGVAKKKPKTPLAIKEISKSKVPIKLAKKTDAPSIKKEEEIDFWGEIENQRVTEPAKKPARKIIDAKKNLNGNSILDDKNRDKDDIAESMVVVLEPEAKSNTSQEIGPRDETKKLIAVEKKSNKVKKKKTSEGGECKKKVQEKAATKTILERFTSDEAVDETSQRPEQLEQQRENLGEKSSVNEKSCVEKVCESSENEKFERNLSTIVEEASSPISEKIPTRIDLVDLVTSTVSEEEKIASTKLDAAQSLSSPSDIVETKEEPSTKVPLPSAPSTFIEPEVIANKLEEKREDEVATELASVAAEAQSLTQSSPSVSAIPTILVIDAPGTPPLDGEQPEIQSAVPEIKVLEDETEDDPGTPTNETIDGIIETHSNSISKWNARADLSLDEPDKDIGPEVVPVTKEASKKDSSKKKKIGTSKKVSSKKNSVGTSTPTGASPDSSKKKKLGKRKKSSIKNAINDERSGSKISNSSDTTLKPGGLNIRYSPKNSERNSPKQRPLDLIKMFYTTPASLLTATPRDLSKVRRAKIKKKKHSSRTASASSDSTGSTRSTQSTGTAESTGSTEHEDDTEQKRISSTRSNDSGFDGSPRLSNCDMACHKKCEKLTGNLCGLNQKLVAEALQALKRAPSQSSDNQRNSDGSDHHASGRVTPPATNLPRFKKYTVMDFNFLKVLGKGSFGKVLLAELRRTDCVYAVKCLKKDVVLEDDDVECTLIERKVLTLATRHPYLCHLFCTFQTDSHLFFVMEYLNGGDLMFHIQKSGRFAESRARFYAAEIWSGLNFLHKKGIVYRDLKLDNVLLDFEGHIRIADFGMCKLQIFLDRTADTFCGTPDYMAPEIIKGLKYNQMVDWWSFGVLLYEMLTGQSPFSGCDEDDLFWSICNERPFIPRYLSQEAMDVLVCLLEKDAGKRPPAHEIAVHPFFHALQWDRLERRQLEPPFKPALEHTLDTRYFDTAFTAERPRLTPVPEQILTSMDQGVFRGFSYTNPNATD